MILFSFILILVIYYDKASTLELSSLIASINRGTSFSYATAKVPSSRTIVVPGRFSNAISWARTPVSSPFFLDCSFHSKVFPLIERTL